MRDNDYTSNQERRRRRMQTGDSGWGVEADAASRGRSGQSTANRNGSYASSEMSDYSRQSRSSAQSGRSGAAQGRSSAKSGRSGATQGRSSAQSDRSGAAQGRSGSQSGRSGAMQDRGSSQSGRGGSYASSEMSDYSRQSRSSAQSGRSGAAQGRSGSQSGRGGAAQSRGGSPSGRGGAAQGRSGYNQDYTYMPNPHDDYQRKPKNQRKKKHTIGKVIALLQAVLSLVVLGVVFILDVLPIMYVGILAGVLILLWIFAFFSQYTKKSHIPGKVLSVLMCCILGLGSYYLLITKNMLSQITNVAYSVDNMIVVVLNDNPAQSLQDAADYTFGIQTGFEKDKVEHAVDEVNQALNKTITTQDYESMQAQVQALYDGQVGAIIYNEGFKGTIEESFPEFSIQTRTLKNVEIKTKVELSDSNKSNADVTEEPFLVYISGNDGYGTVSVSGRSDVNMLVAVNPKTRQILMVNTPRDYYVEFPGVTGGQKDKLTHAGNYGMDCLMNTLENIYGYDIDYYVRVNFDSMIRMVDALGGVTVVSDYDFTAIDGNHFNQGENYVNGEQALSFVRERKNVPGGDFQRGRDQQLMLTAMINKAMSPAILTGYTGIIASLENSFATSMPEDSITALIKMQLSDGGSWNIVSTAVTGTTDSQYCYSYSGNPLSVVIPDAASIEAASAMLGQLYNGETLVQPSAEMTNQP